MRNIEKIRRYTPCKHAKINLVINEVEDIIDRLHKLDRGIDSNYNIHKVSLDKNPYWTGDAKYLNKHTNQKRRGNLRYLFDVDTLEYCGFAKELDSGQYKKIM